MKKKKLPSESILDRARVGKPCQPTSALPGTEDKIEVLRSRVSRRQELHHPDDTIVDEYRSLETVVPRNGKVQVIGTIVEKVVRQLRTSSLGDRLYHLRTSRRWTMKKLASRSGVSKQTISAIETGDTTDPRLSVLLALAKGLEISLDLLVGNKQTI